MNLAATPRTASRLNILGVPFLFIYDKGQARESMPGIGDKHELMMKMAPYL
jgi:hypothetical protein